MPDYVDAYAQSPGDRVVGYAYIPTISHVIHFVCALALEIIAFSSVTHTICEMRRGTNAECGASRSVSM